MTPIDHASSILGEHMSSYIVVCVHPDDPDTCVIKYDSFFAAKGMLEHVIEVHFSSVGVDTEWEIEEDGEDEADE